MKRGYSVLEAKEIVINTNLVLTEEIFMIWLFYSPNPQFIALFLCVSKKFKNWIVDFISMDKKLESYQPDSKWIDNLLQNMNPIKSNQSFYDHRASQYTGLYDLTVFYKDDAGVVSFANAMSKNIREKTFNSCFSYTLIDNMKKITVVKPAPHILLWDPISFAVEEWRRKNLKEVSDWLYRCKIDEIIDVFRSRSRSSSRSYESYEIDEKSEEEKHVFK